MSEQLNIYGIEKYHNQSQKIRVITESWVNENIFCPNCGSNIKKFENNKPVADFFCPICSEEYELKSKKNKLGNKIVDGAYSTMVERINSENNPNFFFLTYSSENYRLNDFLTIPKQFFLTEMIEKRAALSENAKRAGWVGCNLLLNSIPEIGKIYFIKDSKSLEKADVLEKWKTTLKFRENSADSRGWLFEILKCVDKINESEFSLKDMYRFESKLREKFPLNNNIQAKIRQQLQILRDKEIIYFTKRGEYKKI